MKSHYLTINGIKIFYLELGKGKPALFLHGHRSNALRWEGILRKVSEKHQVFAPDLPGFGKSDQLPVSHKIENYEPYLLELIEKLDFPKFTLIGASLGAVLAVLMAQKIPERVEKIILLGPIFDRTSFKIPRLKYILGLFFLSIFPRNKTLMRIIDRLIKSDRIFKNFLKIYFAPEQQRPEILDYEAKQWRLMSIRVWAQTLLSMLTFRFSQNPRPLNIPAILISPGNDQYLDVEKTIKKFSQIFPQKEVVIIPGLAHMPKGDLSQVLNLPQVQKLLAEI